MTRKNTIEKAKEVLRIEEEGLATVRNAIGEEFATAVETILACPGRIVFAGVGKSGLIAHKIVATFNSIGIPSMFLHPVEAMHGDLGMVAKNDVIIAISYSGETTELNALLTAIASRGNTIIAITGGVHSTLAKNAEIVLNARVPQEACPLGLAPTASTTATLAIGDALSVVLINCRNFQAEDFRQNHPGGSLGQRLKLEVTEVMSSGINIPAVQEDASATEAIAALNEKNKGAVLILSLTGEIRGIVTDGDIRRVFASGTNKGEMDKIFAHQLMTENPIFIESKCLAVDALSIMQKYEITALPVLDEEKKLIGLLHLHDLLGKGEFRFLV